MAAAIICREYGWTFDQYLDQPTAWLNTIHSMMRVEAEEMRRKSKK